MNKFLPLLIWMMCLSGVTRAQTLKVINLNTHDTTLISEGQNYFYGIEGEKNVFYGSLITKGDSSIEAGGKRFGPEKLLWLSKSKRPPRNKADKVARFALSLYGLGVLISGIYYLDNGDTAPLKLSGLYGAGLGIPAILWLGLKRGPDYDLRGSWMAVVE
jgi:hypothetical protein